MFLQTYVCLVRYSYSLITRTGNGFWWLFDRFCLGVRKNKYKSSVFLEPQYPVRSPVLRFQGWSTKRFPVADCTPGKLPEFPRFMAVHYNFSVFCSTSIHTQIFKQKTYFLIAKGFPRADLFSIWFEVVLSPEQQCLLKRSTQGSRFLWFHRRVELWVKTLEKSPWKTSSSCVYFSAKLSLSGSPSSTASVRPFTTRKDDDDGQNRETSWAIYLLC